MWPEAHRSLSAEGRASPVAYRSVPTWRVDLTKNGPIFRVLFARSYSPYVSKLYTKKNNITTKGGEAMAVRSDGRTEEGSHVPQKGGTPRVFKFSEKIKGSSLLLAHYRKGG